MINKSITSIILAASCVVFSPFSCAAADDMNKDEWLGKLKQVVPDMICTNFMKNESVSKQLKTFNIDYNKCVSLIPASVDKCRDKFYKDIPATINKDTAQSWGSTIGQCIGTDFAVTWLSSAAPESAAPTAPAEGGASAPGSSDDSAAAVSSADESVPAPASTDGKSDDVLTKDAWLGKLQTVVPDLICKGFLADEALGKQLAKQNIDYDKCVTLIPPSMEKCVKDLYPAMPATINEESAGKWGHQIGECIGKDFAVKYLI